MTPDMKEYAENCFRTFIVNAENEVEKNIFRRFAFELGLKISEDGQE